MNHLRHGRLVNIPYYLLGCIKNMSYYCKWVKFPLLSLTHHRLCQLLIHRGFAQQNPPLNNPPLIPQETPESSYERQLEDIPDPPLIPSSELVDPSPNSSHLVESPHPTVHISSDDSQAETPHSPPTHKRKRRIATVSVSKRQTRATSQAVTSSDSPSPRK